MSWKQQRISLSKIEEEYSKDFMKDDERMYRIKSAIEELSDLDRALIIMYADDESMAKTGKKFGVSSATICSNIKRIRELIKDKI